MARPTENECVFCAIATTDRSRVVAETDECLVFQDINPASAAHYLVIPKQHIGNVATLRVFHIGLLERMLQLGTQVLRKQGYESSEIRLGFHRPPFNSIEHLHLHCIGLPMARWWGRWVFPARNTPWFYHGTRLLAKLTPPAP
ncbi:hypothetical protein H4R35_001170 [Dimargaris xerosporica]|nr:hypothetical protein H4R35_001170 [Dimargaris xerosporica]